MNPAPISTWQETALEDLTLVLTTLTADSTGAPRSVPRSSTA